MGLHEVYMVCRQERKIAVVAAFFMPCFGLYVSKIFHIIII